MTDTFATVTTPAFQERRALLRVVRMVAEAPTSVVPVTGIMIVVMKMRCVYPPAMAPTTLLMDIATYPIVAKADLVLTAPNAFKREIARPRAWMLAKMILNAAPVIGAMSLVFVYRGVPRAHVQLGLFAAKAAAVCSMLVRHRQDRFPTVAV